MRGRRGGHEREREREKERDKKREYKDFKVKKSVQKKKFLNQGERERRTKKSQQNVQKKANKKSASFFFTLYVF